eukprot:7021504-Alexandrium_andersonii.AAC.1
MHPRTLDAEPGNLAHERCSRHPSRALGQSPLFCPRTRPLELHSLPPLRCKEGVHPCARDGRWPILRRGLQLPLAPEVAADPR